MSYGIVKNVKIKDKKIFINYRSNNVLPKTYGWAEYAKPGNSFEDNLYDFYNEIACTGGLEIARSNTHYKIAKELRRMGVDVIDGWHKLKKSSFMENYFLAKKIANKKNRIEGIVFFESADGPCYVKKNTKNKTYYTLDKDCALRCNTYQYEHLVDTIEGRAFIFLI